MKTQNSILIATLAALVFALAPFADAAPTIIPPPLPVITIYSGWGGNHICRGRTGSFALETNPPFFGTYVNFKVSGTAIPGVDYVALISPAYIPSSGYGAISLRTLADPRGSLNNQIYSVVVTLEPGPGYTVGVPNSAVIWISSSCGVD